MLVALGLVIVAWSGGDAREVEAPNHCSAPGVAVPGPDDLVNECRPIVPAVDVVTKGFGCDVAGAKPRDLASLEGKPDTREVWSLTLPDAIRIALDNSEEVRVLSRGLGALGGRSFENPDPIPPLRPRLTDLKSPEKPEGPAAAAKPLVIARINTDVDLDRFRSETMALVRSVEQQYWALSQQQVQLWSRETAVEISAEIVRKEEGKHATRSGKLQDLAEAKEQLERFRLDLVTATADLITTERQLRDLMGLKPTDNRRIIPSTSPREDQVKPDWEACLARMIQHQPDIRQQDREVATAQVRAFVSDVIGSNGGPGSNTSRAREQLRRQREFHDQIVHQTTHRLNRFFLEVDSNYIHFKTAGRVRTAAARRLEVQQARYDVGEVTVDRYLDAVSRWATAVALEAQFKSSYNVSLCALDETQGTLLDSANIAVTEGPKPRRAYARVIEPKPTRDDATVRASVETANPKLKCEAGSCPSKAKAGQVEYTVIRILVGPLLQVQLHFSNDHAAQPHRLVLGVPGLGVAY